MSYEVLRRRLVDGAQTTVHVVRHARASTRLRVQHFERPTPLDEWCEASGVPEALAGGFFVRPAGPSLGELWVRGERVASVGWRTPFADVRAAVHAGESDVAIGPRHAFAPRPEGDLLQAGPLLVAGGAAVIAEDPEGFATDAAQFDSDITRGRYPRTALGLSDEHLIAVACEGRRTAVDAGLTLGELAELMLELGAATALNLDGGGSTALIHRGHLLNRPYELQDRPLPRCRPVMTALVFEHR